MTDAIRGIDHAIIGVRDLDAARAQFERLGFTAAPLGNHVGKATANHCIMFADSYLELLGINEPDKLDTLGLDAFLEARGEGLVKIALGTPDADTARADIEAEGFSPTGPDDLARPLTDRPDAIVRFRNLQIPERETGGLGTFLCGHKTPELMRPPGSMDHANGARNLVAAAAVVDDVEAVAGPWARLLGRPAAGGALDIGRGHVYLATPADAAGSAGPYGPLPDPLPTRPFYLGLRVEVASIGAAKEALARSGIAPASETPGCIRIAPEDACGVRLEFAEA
ncbi:MAG: VOC family protein [Alphaproteobacteria bacterium]|nr:VOC family protein [Alphaproteobacteria bacterium]